MTHDAAPILDLLHQRSEGRDIKQMNATKKMYPLHLAVSYEVPSNIDWLLRNGADRYALDEWERTPFEFALTLGFIPCAEKLLASNPSEVNRRDEARWWRTPLHLAVQHEQVDSINFLLQKGADRRALDQHNRTPFELAVAGNLRQSF